jgi:hypothetical protein
MGLPQAMCFPIFLAGGSFEVIVALQDIGGAVSYDSWRRVSRVRSLILGAVCCRVDRAVQVQLFCSLTRGRILNDTGPPLRQKRFLACELF